MSECVTCGTIHGTAAYRVDGESVSYCVGCAPADVERVERRPVVEYPDRRS